MIKIFDATLDLFIYHLREGLGEKSTEICQKYDNFWLYLPEKLEKYFPSVPIKEKNRLKFENHINSHPINGSYKRVTIDDTDSLWYSASFPYIGTEILDSLPHLKKLAPEKIDETGYLGQTWMITGWLDEIVDDETKLSLAEKDAEKAYEVLLNKKPAYCEKKEFLEATVFELWRTSESQWDGIEKDSHVLIIFYQNVENFAKSANYYNDWRYLLYCRHKIIFAYEQAKELSSSLLKDYSQSSPKVSELSQQDLNQLKNSLQENINTLARYVQNINHLETQKSTLQVNLRNYKRKCEDEPFKNVNSLQKFSQIATNKYQTQIEDDLISLRPGLSIRENLTATIRGMVEIKQAESDRRIERNIAIAGFGIGAASAAASSIANFIDKITTLPTTETIEIPNQPPVTQPLPINATINFLIAFIISLAFGSAFAFLAWLLLPKERRPPKL